MRAIIGVVLAGVLAGCSNGAALRTTMLEKLEPDRPTEYREGFSDGCQSATHERHASWGMPSEGFARNDQRMITDAQYHVGWLDGQRKCTLQGGGDIFLIKK